MNNIELKKQKYDTIFKVGLIGVAALIISPIIFAVVQGIVGAAIAGLVGLIAVNAAPVVSMKLANWKIKGIVNEAKENPIETLTNLIIESKRAFDVAETATVNAVTARDTFVRKADNFSRKYPARAAEFALKKEQLEEATEKKKAALQNMKNDIEKSETVLDEMKAYWDVSQSLQAANKAIGNIGDQYAQLKRDTSYDAVYESLSRSFAELEVASAIDVEKLTNEPSQPIGTILDVKSKTVV